jgi:hypothetical protein
MTTKITKDNITASTITTTQINDGTIINDDVSSGAAISISKISGAASSADLGGLQDNIALLGFKMAVADGLTLFNLSEGIVDEFNDETGTLESLGSNDYYSAPGDFYTNNQSSGSSFVQIGSDHVSNEPDTTLNGSPGTTASATFARYTVPSGMTSLNVKMWGAGAGGLNAGGGNWGQPFSTGGGGGFVSGTLATSPGTNLYIGVSSQGGAGPSGAAYGGGQSVKFTSTGSGGGHLTSSSTFAGISSAPQLYLSVGGGGSAFGTGGRNGGAGGGLTGQAGPSAQGGSQSAGGSPGGGFLNAGSRNDGPNPWAYYGLGGGGYYGGGTAQGPNGQTGEGGGGGSSYFGNPNISSGATEGGSGAEGGGVGDPLYGSPTTGSPGLINEGDFNDAGDPVSTSPEPGYVVISGSFLNVGEPGGGNTTIVSKSFTASTTPTSARIVLFEEDVDSPSLNTDVIASVSRDGGATFSAVTLAGGSYVTGSSGTRILSGSADISGQPSGTEMRWKLELANNTVKVHGISLQWK